MAKINVIATVVVFTLALGGCGFDKEPPAAEGSAALKPIPTTPQEDIADEPAEKGGDRLEAFADQMVERGPGAFRFDRIRDAKAGGKERQVFVELLGASDQEAAALAAELLESLGFKAGHRFGDENGIRLNFQYRDEAPVRVLVRTREAHSKLANDAATSSVYVTQPLASM